jgi:uncharacterized protein YbjT (DUF2867 family)
MRVAIIGGTGFVGSYICEALAAAGHELSLLVRDGSGDRVDHAPGARLVTGDIESKEALADLLDGCDALIYNVGILREVPSEGVTFEAVQYEGVVFAVEAARNAGVRRILLMSANGVKKPGTRYQETKWRAEQFALHSGLDVTVLRPSIVFGDPRGRMEFATQLCNDMVCQPFPAISFFSGINIERGAVVMSPVHVEDVAQAFVAALEDDATIGKTYELGGPEALTWTDMIVRIAEAVGRSKWIVPMPMSLMRLNATLFDWLPFFPVTRDQLTMLEEGNTADPAVIEGLTGKPPRRFTPAELAYLAD